MAQAAQPASAANGAAGASSSSNAAGGSSTASSKDIPRDARIIGLILASLGVTDAEPGVVAMLLEFAHRYTLEVLQDGQVYAEHAQRPRDASAASTYPLEVEDLRMAVSSKLEHSYSSPLPKEFLLPLAAQINRVPLPILPESYGIRLPHERDRLTAVNWDLAPVTGKRTYAELEQENQTQQGQSMDATASTSQGAAVNGAGNGINSGMDLDMASNDLFGGHGDDEDEDDDDEDDEDMEEVLDTSVQVDRAASKDVEDADADEDAEEEDAEEDDDNAEDDDDEDGDGDGDGDGQEDT